MEGAGQESLCLEHKSLELRVEQVMSFGFGFMVYNLGLGF